MNDMRVIKKGLDAKLNASPNLVEESANDVFKSYKPELIADDIPKLMLTSNAKLRASKMAARSEIRIGMPRVLNMYSLTPVFSGYFESLGIPSKNLVYSKFTNEKLYKRSVFLSR